MSFDVRTGLSMTGPSPAMKFSFKPIGSTGNSRSAKMIAASTSRSLHRLQRHLRRQIGSLAESPRMP